MPVTVDHFVLSNGDTAKYDYSGLVNVPTFNDYLKLLGIGGTEIADNADLNTATYCTPGVYVCPTNVKANALTNCPTRYLFIMIVRSQTGSFASDGKWNYVEREIISNYSPRIWKQNASSNGSGTYSFTDWFRFEGSPYSVLTTATQSAEATGWTLTYAQTECRAGACWVKFEASFSGSGVNDWVTIATGLPTTDRAWFWQSIDDNGKRYKLRVSSSGELSVKNSQSASTLYVDTTITYPINNV